MNDVMTSLNMLYRSQLVEVLDRYGSFFVSMGFKVAEFKDFTFFVFLSGRHVIA